jgi:pyruvate dehydrogenase (quinone)
MNGNAELLTVAKYRKRWADQRIIFLVLNNSDLNQVTWEMRVMSGNPKFEASQDLPPFSYAAYAEQLGFLGIRLDDPSQVEAAWRRALAADRPVVIDAIVDPTVVQLPPHISFEEAHNYMSAMMKRDPQEVSVIKESIKEMIAGITPHSKK